MVRGSQVRASLASAKAAAAEVVATGAPRSVLSIATSVLDGPLSHIKEHDVESSTSTTKPRMPGAAIRQVGSMRRVFALNPTLTCEEMEGLGYRIKVLGKNTSLSSILLTNVVQSDSDAAKVLPLCVSEYDRKRTDLLDDGLSPLGLDEVWSAFEGYDARALLDAHPQEKKQLLEAMSSLALSVKGEKPRQMQGEGQHQLFSRYNFSKKKNNDNADAESDGTSYSSKIPFITVPHGRITDGGYALAMGSYVLATDDSQFQIQNTLRGLSLDPIGLSYILPRLGQEFEQISANYPVGSILALAGYKADCYDMVETGLATHYIRSFGKVATIERALSEARPYYQQRLLKDPIKFYGQNSNNNNKRIKKDPNAQFRNVEVAQLLYTACEYDAAGQEFADQQTLIEDQQTFLSIEDPSIVLDHEKSVMLGDRSSYLLDVAGAFRSVFETEDEVEGILERLREIASEVTEDREEQEGIDVAQSMVERMEAQSPLATKATFELLRLGKRQNESLESCMQREKNVQLNLFGMDDYNNWAKSGLDLGKFNDWKHATLKDVTKDEVEELFGGN